jgi:hypothetical protein
MLWKNEMPNLKEIVLDAEVGARRFYESLGFKSRGLSGYVLKSPKGYLLKSILTMTHHCKNLREGAIKELSRMIVKEVKALQKQARDERTLSRRRAALSAVKECVKPETRPELSRAAFLALIQYRKKIPEAMEILPEDASKEATEHAVPSGR